MYGWRARIGYVSPSPVDGPGLNFYSVCPPGVTLVCTNLTVHEIDESVLGRADEAVLHAVKALAKDEVDYIVLAGEPVVFLSGYSQVHRWQELVRSVTDIPMTTNVMAAVEALHHLGVRRPAVLVPYRVRGEDGSDRTDLLKTFLEDAGFEVSGFRGLGVPSNLAISRLPHYLPYQEAKKLIAQTPGADGLYIPCARWAAFDHIERLEQDLGIPVVSSIQSWIWKAFRDLGIRDPIPGHGRLLHSARVESTGGVPT